MEENRLSNQRGLHITIEASPPLGYRMGQGMKDLLGNDLRLIKAGLLYAEKVELCSFQSSLMLERLSLTEFDLKGQLEYLKKLAPVMEKDKQRLELALRNLENYERELLSKHPTREQLKKRSQFQREIWEPFKAQTVNMTDETKVKEIRQAIESGLLELHPFDISREKSADDLSSAAVKEFLESIQETIVDGSTYPLFDDFTSALVRAGLKEKTFYVSEISTERGKHVSLVSHLFERLPVFEQATVGEILDIRRELKKSLVRFRSAIIRFSDDIKTASWDENFAPEAEKVFYRYIEPAILEIEEAVQTNKYLKELCRKFAERPQLFDPGAGLGVLLSQLTNLPDIIAIALGLGVGVGTLAYKAYDDWVKKKQETEQNQLFFYYGVKQRLSGKSHSH